MWLQGQVSLEGAGSLEQPVPGTCASKGETGGAEGNKTVSI